MISGYSQSSTSGNMNKLYLVKTNHFGDTIWTRSFNNHFFVNGNCVAQTIDSGYIITGNEDITGYNPNLYLFKLDKYGIEEWSVTYGGNNLDYGLCVEQTNDEGFIVSGTNSSIGAGGEDVFLLKTNNLGIATGVVHKEFDKLIEIFPNPTTNRITVKANNLKRIELMDLRGKEIYTKETQREN